MKALAMLLLALSACVDGGEPQLDAGPVPSCASVGCESMPSSDPTTFARCDREIDRRCFCPVEGGEVVECLP